VEGVESSEQGQTFQNFFAFDPLKRAVERWSGYLKQFLCWYGAKKLPFSAVGITDLDAFLTSCGAKGCSRISINNKATGLRAFFRYAGARGWCDPLIAEAIKGPRIFAQENLPSGPSWQDVRRMRKFGISSPHTGPHSLRHACAQEPENKRRIIFELGISSPYLVNLVLNASN